MRDWGGLGRPLRVPVFRNLLIADLVSDIGTFMQNVGAAWRMVSLHAALVTSLSSKPRPPFHTFYWHYLRVPLAISSIVADSFSLQKAG